MTTIQKIALSLAALMGLATLAPAFALAQTAGATAVGASASTTVKLGAAEQRAKDRGDKEIDRRIQALTDLAARVSAMQRISDSFKQNLTTNVQNEITSFTALKAKIDADTDVATLKADIKSITDSYRVFALVIPQGRISAAADRLVVMADMMGTVGTKLQARIQTAASAGADVTALNAALTDLGTKLADMQAKAQAAVTATATLVPDNGDKTKMQANAKALQDARADIVAGIKSTNDARKDIDAILKGLKSINTSTTTASSTTPR